MTMTIYVDNTQHSHKPKGFEMAQAYESLNTVATNTKSLNNLSAMIVDQISKGACYINAQMQHSEFNEETQEFKFEFKQSNLVCVDVDKTANKTLDDVKADFPNAMLAHHTFSSTDEMLHCRIWFMLSELVCDYERYQSICEFICEQVTEKGYVVDADATKQINPIRSFNKKANATHNIVFISKSMYDVNDVPQLAIEREVVEVPVIPHVEFEVKFAEYQAQEAEENKLFAEAIAEQERVVEQELTVLAQRKDEVNKGKKFTEEALFEMAKYISYSNTDSFEKREWFKFAVGLKRYQEAGHISDVTALTLLEEITVIDDAYGIDYMMKVYNSIDTALNKKGRNATISAWFTEAKKNGYVPSERVRKSMNPHEATKAIKSESYSLMHEKNNTKVTNIELEGQYITADDMKMILNVAHGKIALAQAPTGTGKSTAVMEVATNHEDKNVVFIIAEPTKFIAKQLTGERDNVIAKYVASDMITLVGEGTSHSKRQEIRNSFTNGIRVFVTTYDSVSDVMYEFRKDGVEFALIVDEIHHLVSDYDTEFRYEAIAKLREAFNYSKTVLGLTATAQQLPLNLFNRFLNITPQGGNKELFEKLQVANIESDVVTDTASHVMSRLNAGYRQIVFLDNKTEIKQIAKVLEANSLKVDIITATDKDESYGTIAEKGEIKKDVDVILSTSVMTEGVSILNEDDKFEVTVVLSGKTSFYNPVNIIQASNRLRNKYHALTLMKHAKDGEADYEKNNLLNRFNYYLNKAKLYVNFLTNELELTFAQKEGLTLNTDVLEQNCGVYFNTATATFEIDYIHLAHKAVNAMRAFNMKFSNDYVNVVASYFQKDLTVLNNTVEVAVEQVESVKSAHEAQVQKDIQIGRADYRGLSNNAVRKQYEGKGFDTELKELTKLSTLVDYETAIKSLNVKTDKLSNDIKALTDLIFLTDKKSTLSNLKTLQVYAALKVCLDELEAPVGLKNEQLTQLFKNVAKERKVTVDEVKTVFKKFFRKAELSRVRENGNQSRIYTVNALTFGYVASKYNTDTATIRKAVVANAQQTKGLKLPKNVEQAVITKEVEYLIA